MTTQQRNFAIAAVAAALGAVIVAFALQQQAMSPTAIASASPSPTAIATSPSVAPSPSASRSVTPTATSTAAVPASPSAAPSGSAAASDGRYGWIVVGGGGFAIVDESAKTVHQQACGAPGRGCGVTFVAVSPDGRRVAFWLAAQQSQWELRALEVAQPAQVRTIATLPQGMEGQGLAWSSDSAGVLYAAQTTGYGGIQGGAGKAVLNGATLTGGTTADVMPARTDGFLYVPVAWDRQRNIASAVLTGEGGFLVEYAVSVGGRYSASKAPGQMAVFALRASADATRVLGVDMTGNVLHVWHTEDISKQVDIPAAARINGALWQMSSVAWAVFDHLDVFIPQTSSSRTVYKGTGEIRLTAMRADGSGALLATGGAPNVSNNWIVVDMASGAILSRISLDVNQVVLSRGVFLP